MHVAIIMNGNSRWATQRGLPPTAPRSEAVAALRNTVGLAAAAGVRTLTLYALSTPGCTRPPQEIDADLGVLGTYLRSDLQGCHDRSIRVDVIGNNEQLRAALPRDLVCPGLSQAAASRMNFRIVVDYSAHDSVVKAAWRSPHPRAPESFDQQLREIDQTALPAGAVDLLGSHWRRPLPERIHALGSRLRAAALCRLSVAGLYRALLSTRARLLRRRR